MKQLLTFSILFISLFAFSQSDECGTDDLHDNLTEDLQDYSKAASDPVYLPPWFGNNEYLYDILESKDYFNEPGQEGLKSLTTCNHPVDYLVPVDIHVWRNTSGTNSINSNQLDDIFNRVNEIYRDNNTRIQFYYNEVYWRNNTKFNNGIRNNATVLLMFLAGSNANAINVHIIHNNGDKETALGAANPPNLGYLLKYKCYIRTHENGTGNIMDIDEIAATLAHELGHTLGLDHTHHPGRSLFADDNASTSDCYQESVSRTRKNKRWKEGCLSNYDVLKCEVNGDFLPGTQADPGLHMAAISSGCALTLPASGNYHADNWGVHWTPDVRNVMSYSRRICRDNFHAEQIAVMWHWLDTDFFSTRDNIVSYQGADIVCNSQAKEFTASLITDANYSWSTTNNLYVHSSSDNQAFIKATSSASGYAWVNVHVTPSYAEFCYSKRVWAGIPEIPSISGPSDLFCHDLSLYYEANNRIANWSVSGPIQLRSGNIGYQCTIKALSEGTAYVYATRNNECGTTSRDEIQVEVQCYKFISYPNPVKDVLNLKYVNKHGNLADIKGKYDVQIRDLDNNLIQSDSYESNNTQIDTDDIPNGNYILHIVHKNKNHSNQIIINK